jgi:hypothetical protein
MKNLSWTYYAYNLTTKVPGYNERYFVPDTNNDGWTAFGGLPNTSTPSINGSYSQHGDTNPPTPYRGKVYMIRSNALIAWGSTTSPVKVLPQAKIKPASSSPPFPVSSELKTKIEKEVESILATGPLKPGYHNGGIPDASLNWNCGNNLADYFHTPAENVYYLLRTLPHISPALQEQVKAFVKQWYSPLPINNAPYKLYQYTHVGWKDGSYRDFFDKPPEFTTESTKYGPQQLGSNGYLTYRFNPLAYYAMWRYSVAFNLNSADSLSVLNAGKNSYYLNQSFTTIPADTVLINDPIAHNAYIAGYIGYVELAKRAGQTASNEQNQLNRLLALRASNFSKDVPASFITPLSSLRRCRTLAQSRNFIYMVPELAQYLRQNALAQVQAAITESTQLAPYWFITLMEIQFDEGVIRNPYDSHSIFQAKAQILNEPYGELAKYLDIPAFERGDLFYIDNLVSAIEASELKPPPSTDFDNDGDTDIIDLFTLIGNYNRSGLGDVNKSGIVDLFDVNHIFKAFH